MISVFGFWEKKGRGMVDVIKYPSVESLTKVNPFFEATDKVVWIQEKIDGSNVGILWTEEDGLVIQSRTTIIDQSSPGMFKKVVDWAVANVDKFQDHFGYLFYGEMPGNGKLRYPDAPPFIVFDIFYPQTNTWLFPDVIARDMGIPYASFLYEGGYHSIEHVQSFIGQSQFGDVTVEGVVVKSFEVPCWYENKTTGETMHYTAPLLAGKVVREDYKETKAPKTNLAHVVDPLYAIAEALVTPARLQKAVQRLQEEGRYDPDKPHLLIPIVSQDVHKEDQDYVKELLFNAYWKQLGRSIAQRTIELANGGTA